MPERFHGIGGVLKVTVELFGVHRQIAGIDKIELPVGERVLVGDALDYIREKYPSISLVEHSILVTVNHQVASLDRPLKPNDTICILPHIGGG
jgi:molybdopterin converting factor small subunit